MWYLITGGYPPFMPPGAHGLPADVPSSVYSNGMSYNNISPNAINSYRSNPLFDPHAAHMRSGAIGNIPGGKP